MPLSSLLAKLARRRRLTLDEDDFEQELRSHLTMAERERIAGGEDPASARLSTLKEFGNLALTKEAARAVWTPRWLEALRDLIGDVRYAARSLAKHPLFALTVIAVLTLGIGANAAVFTMLKGMTLSPLAGVDGSARLGVVFAETSTGRDGAISYPDYQFLRDHDQVFTGLFGTTVGNVFLDKGQRARRIFAEIVSGNYFQELGVPAELGRTLLPSDETVPGKPAVVVLSDALWRRDFDADPAIVGRTIEINHYPLTVVGIADRTFHGTIVSYDVEAFVPVTIAPQLGFKFGSAETTASGILGDRRGDVFYVHGRLRSGSSLGSARAEMNALWTTMMQDRPASETLQHVAVVPFWRSPNGAQTYLLPTLAVLTVMGLFVLLIACANIAGLVLVRGVSRRGEIAVRLALGATRARIVRLMVVENLVLAVPGALLGTLLAFDGIPLLVSYAERLAVPDRVYFNVQFDSLVLGFSAFIACASALVFGFVPALQTSKVDLVTVINEDASPRGASRGRLRAGLVVSQVAVSLLLLVGAGLAARSVDAARRANPGFDANQVTAVALDVKQNAYTERQGRAFYHRLLDAMRSDPEVQTATLAAYVPLALIDTRAQRVALDGYVPRRGEDLMFMSNAVAGDYFRTLRIGMLAGREFDEHDDEQAAPVAIVNATLAQRFWNGPSSAIGKRLRIADGSWRTVVGVAADVKYSRINEPPRPYVYLPFFQAYRTGMVLHTRGAGSTDRLVERARAAIAAIDPDLPVLTARPLINERRGAFLFLDLTAFMLLIFGSVGMALAAMGTYGLVSYTVKQSMHEIGIRIALGAPAAAVVRVFIARGLRLGAIGAAIGVVAALGVGRLIGSVLYGVSTTDLVAYSRALAIVFGGVAVATIVPAWRATRANPLVALRHQ